MTRLTFGKLLEKLYPSKSNKTWKVHVVDWEKNRLLVNQAEDQRLSDINTEEEVIGYAKRVSKKYPDAKVLVILEKGWHGSIWHIFQKFFMVYSNTKLYKIGYLLDPRVFFARYAIEKHDKFLVA